MIEWFSTKDILPKHGQRVLIYNGGVDVATFKQGISEERAKMIAGEVEDYEEEGWCVTMGHMMLKRSSIRKAYDEGGNNIVPYGWDIDGTVLFGHRVTHWAPLNTPGQYKEERIRELTKETEILRRSMAFDDLMSRLTTIKP